MPMQHHILACIFIFFVGRHSVHLLADFGFIRGDEVPDGVIVLGALTLWFFRWRQMRQEEEEA